MKNDRGRSRQVLDEPFERVSTSQDVYVNDGLIVPCAERIARIQTINSSLEVPVGPVPLNICASTPRFVASCPFCDGSRPTPVHEPSILHLNHTLDGLA